MDYFQCFGIPRLLNLDREHLESQYYALSRTFHPDFFENKPPMEQSISLSNSAILNTAYQTLKDPTRRIQYLLEIESGTSETQPSPPPEDLFEELMAIHDDVIALKQSNDHNASDARGISDRLDASRAFLETKRNGFFQRLQALFVEWDRLICNHAGSRSLDSDKEALLSQMRALISDQSYVTRMLDDINALRSGT